MCINFVMESSNGLHIIICKHQLYFGMVIELEFILTFMQHCGYVGKFSSYRLYLGRMTQTRGCMLCLCQPTQIKDCVLCLGRPTKKKGYGWQ